MGVLQHLGCDPLLDVCISVRAVTSSNQSATAGGGTTVTFKSSRVAVKTLCTVSKSKRTKQCANQQVCL